MCHENGMHHRSNTISRTHPPVKIVPSLDCPSNRRQVKSHHITQNNQSVPSFTVLFLSQVDVVVFSLFLPSPRLDHPLDTQAHAGLPWIQLGYLRKKERDGSQQGTDTSVDSGAV